MPDPKRKLTESDFPDLFPADVIDGKWIDGKLPSNLAVRRYLAAFTRGQRKNNLELAEVMRPAARRYQREAHRHYRNVLIEVETGLGKLHLMRLKGLKTKGGVQ